MQLVRDLSPAVALLDIRMPNLGGLQAARDVLASNPATRVVILTTFDADDYAYEALELAASGFILTEIEAEESE